MGWSGLGGSVWSIRFRELEPLVRHMFRLSRRDPDEELPDAELSAGEQRAAVRREAARRLTERA